MAVNPILKSMTVAEWHENGIICTDGGAMTQLVTTHATLSSLDAAAATAVHAGINQFLDRQRQPVRDALQHGLLVEADIDAALRGVYRVMIRLGSCRTRRSCVHGAHCKVSGVSQSRLARLGPDLMREAH